MKIFLSWSGQRSRAVAESFHSWIPQVIQAVEPWMSSEIEKGRKWSQEISDCLGETAFGIICLTRDNLAAPWILFEAGALSKTPEAFTWTFLYDVSPTDVQQPLAQFQHTVNDKQDVRKLLHTINNVVQGAGEKALAEGLLDKLFEKFWPELEMALAAVPPVKKQQAAELRSDRELLEEVLQTVREISRQPALSPGSQILPAPTVEDLGELTHVRRAWRAVLLDGDGVPAGMKLLLRSMRLEMRSANDIAVLLPSGSPVLDRMESPAMREPLEQALQRRLGFPVRLHFEASAEF